MPPHRDVAARSPSLRDKVAFLRRPDAYSPAPEAVEAIETHMSWVFLTDTLAYKLKKPIRYDVLDFSSLALRRRSCERELRLNRRVDAQLRHLEEARDILGSRVAAGRVVEGHGDLRPEHVFLTDPPAIIDCLEFSRDLRILDPLDELSFLALECERLGAPEVGRWFLDTYLSATRDASPPDLLAGAFGPSGARKSRFGTSATTRSTARRDGGVAPAGTWPPRSPPSLRSDGG